MKNLRKILLTLTVLFASYSYAGAKVIGNGGDMYSQEFVSIGYDILKRLTLAPINEVDINILSQVIMKTQVNSKETLTLGGYEIDAINYPELMRIELNRQAWDRINTKPHEKTFLVLHEYLGIMGVDDSSYQVSRKIDKAQVCSRSEGVKSALENYFHIACDRILPQDLNQIKEFEIKDATGTTDYLVGDFKYFNNLVRLKINRLCRAANDTECLPFKIPSGIFSGLGSLRYLSIFGVKGLETNQFSGAPNLKQMHIGLGSSKIGISQFGDIHPNAFSGLSLEMLVLAGNINTIHANAFKGNIGKFVLQSEPMIPLGGDLPYNLNFGDRNDDSPKCSQPETRIQLISEGAFKGLEKIKKLDLSCMTIEQVEDNVWKDLPNLKDLYLSTKFGMGVIKRNSLQNLTVLENLQIGRADLYSNKKGLDYISKIENGAFDGLKIKKLVLLLSIGSTNDYVFSPLDELLSFTLEGANLQLLKPTFFDKFSKLETLYLKNDQKLDPDYFQIQKLEFAGVGWDENTLFYRKK